MMGMRESNRRIKVHVEVYIVYSRRLVGKDSDLHESATCAEIPRRRLDLVISSTR